ncbi:uncharacterized protein FTOL_07266 [Fusarium torulosum]|uniref:WW domain-containing protein n=1 Tax=Fusarium torulosum TaxID=33205 RepID=A0AAE8MBM8_9HYPO|nr:uncharacterized protein FTOL_07266 [Fusarium torulosum]
MAYQYKPLSNPTDEIRLLKLEPGQRKDSIAFSLDVINTPTDSHPQQNGGRMVATPAEPLPDGWVSAETMSKRVLYERTDTGETSWENPNASMVAQPAPLHDSSVSTASVKFEALSYTWGAPGVTERAVVKDPISPANDTLILEIGKNLAAALRHLRKNGAPRTLWVDAICINQNDNDEKSKQVARMSSIYQNTYRVVVWLGPPSDGGDEFMTILRYLGEQEPEWYWSEVRLPYNGDDWAAISALFKRPYFARLWIMQEILLSSRETVVYCGFSEIPWQVLLWAIVCLVTKEWTPCG